MANVILVHKDKDITILDPYRPIALLNTIYQLLMLITTSRLRQLTEYYALMEGSQYVIRIDLDFKNAFNSAGHSCLWVILRGLGVPDVDFLEALHSNSC